MNPRIEIVKHWGNLAQTRILNEQLLKGELARADWTSSEDSVCLTIDGHWISVSGTSDGEFMMIVSAEGNSSSVPILNYHIDIDDAFSILPRSLRPLLISHFRDSIQKNLEYATAEIGRQCHRSARALMADAMEMSIRLQSIEHDAQDDVASGVFGGMRMTIVGFDGGPKMISHNERRYGTNQ